MKKLLTAAVAVCALNASAQTLNVEVDGDEASVTVPDVQINVRAKGMKPAVEPAAQPAPQPQPQPQAQQPQQPPLRVVGQDTFALDYSPMGVPANTIKVVSPEGALAQVWNEAGQLEGSYAVPFNFQGRGNTYYRFILTLADGQVVFDRKVEVKQFLGGTLRLKGARAAVVVQATPPPPPAAEPAVGMNAADFDALKKAVDDASFSDEKLGVIKVAAEHAGFTVAQVGELVDLMAHSSDKLAVVETLNRRIVDRKNGFKLLGHFTFSGDKEKVQALLR